MASKDSTGGTTPQGKAVRARAEVGGVRSSDDPAPDLWFGEPAEERRDATCSAEVKSSEGRGDGPRGLQAPKTVRELQIALYREVEQSTRRKWNSESRMRENRLSGLMRGGKQCPIHLFPAHSTQTTG